MEWSAEVQGGVNETDKEGSSQNLKTKGHDR